MTPPADKRPSWTPIRSPCPLSLSGLSLLLPLGLMAIALVKIVRLCCVGYNQTIYLILVVYKKETEILYISIIVRHFRPSLSAER